ncbi:MAG: hypothetical protein M0R03_03545 [Novosphingobium sp.]|nr:hypothetical protein [Novosphingobium sp.]
MAYTTTKINGIDVVVLNERTLQGGIQPDETDPYLTVPFTWIGLFRFTNFSGNAVNPTTPSDYAKAMQITDADLSPGLVLSVGKDGSSDAVAFMAAITGLTLGTFIIVGQEGPGVFSEDALEVDQAYIMVFQVDEDQSLKVLVNGKGYQADAINDVGFTNIAKLILGNIIGFKTEMILNAGRQHAYSGILTLEQCNEKAKEMADAYALTWTDVDEFQSV